MYSRDQQTSDMVRTRKRGVIVYTLYVPGKHENGPARCVYKQNDYLIRLAMLSILVVLALYHREELRA